MHIDLNLLTALDALLDEGTVSGAAARLHLSQPAVSRTLARIREATGDAILVRAGRTMVPSPRALAMRAEVSELVRKSRVLLAAAQAFDPLRLERTFTLRCHDALLPGLGSALIRRLRTQAPGVTIRFLAEDAEDLRPGRVDLDIGSAKPVALGLCAEVVTRDVLAVVLRSDHPCARGKLTAKRYAAAQHVVVSRRGRLRDPIDDSLEALGLRRRVVASAPTSTAALQWVNDCNLLVAVASRACSATARSLGLVTRKMPVATTSLSLVQSWQRHFDGDPAHQWLRGLTRAALEGME